MKRLFFVSFLTIFLQQAGSAQCDPFFPRAWSQRPANYDIRVTLDDSNRRLDAVQTLRFQNQSPEPIRTLRLYLYLNAFKNTESTFLHGASRLFGQSFTDRKPEEWGWVDITAFNRENPAGAVDLRAHLRYVQPDDGNTSDQSVLEVPLDQPLMPGETAVFHLNWRAQIPKTFIRAGYSQDFFLLVHWFPQLGVWEQNKAGVWDWNCHQFHRHNEFYADFGVYDVHITTADKFVIGASGCLMDEKINGDKSVTRHYHVEDVIDFAWSAYPHFKVLEDRWNDVNIRLLIPPAHEAMGPRYLHALRFALEYLDRHVGKYPYASITVVDPPFHALRSGLMEYPTLITAGTFYGIPKNIRTSESLVVHEFVHQYFMAMVATNEKEEPWLDEGFATYFEDRIIDAAYGRKHSLIDVFGYQFDNRELTRLEYTTMRNPREGIVARPGWEFSDGNFKPLIYSKTATTLHTLQALLGDEEMDRIVMAYFERWKFKHPRGRDFAATLRSELMAMPDTVLAAQAYGLFENSIYGARVLDYAVTHIENDLIPPAQGVFGPNETDLQYNPGTGAPKRQSKVEIQRLGDWIFPVEVLIRFADGSSETRQLSGEPGLETLIFYDKTVVSAQVDPEHKILLDVDQNNNSLTLQPQTAPLWKYTAKALFWIQNLMQAVGCLG